MKIVLQAIGEVAKNAVSTEETTIPKKITITKEEIKNLQQKLTKEKLEEIRKKYELSSSVKKFKEFDKEFKEIINNLGKNSFEKISEKLLSNEKKDQQDLKMLFDNEKELEEMKKRVKEFLEFPLIGIEILDRKRKKIKEEVKEIIKKNKNSSSLENFDKFIEDAPLSDTLEELLKDENYKIKIERLLEVERKFLGLGIKLLKANLNKITEEEEEKEKKGSDTLESYYEFLKSKNYTELDSKLSDELYYNNKRYNRYEDVQLRELERTRTELHQLGLDILGRHIEKIKENYENTNSIKAFVEFDKETANLYELLKKLSNDKNHQDLKNQITVLQTKLSDIGVRAITNVNKTLLKFKTWEDFDALQNMISDIRNAKQNLKSGAAEYSNQLEELEKNSVQTGKTILVDLCNDALQRQEMSDFKFNKNTSKFNKNTSKLKEKTLDFIKFSENTSKFKEKLDEKLKDQSFEKQYGDEARDLLKAIEKGQKDIFAQTLDAIFPTQPSKKNSPPSKTAVTNSEIFEVAKEIGEKCLLQDENGKKVLKQNLDKNYKELARRIESFMSNYFLEQLKILEKTLSVKPEDFDNLIKMLNDYNEIFYKNSPDATTNPFNILLLKAKKNVVMIDINKLKTDLPIHRKKLEKLDEELKKLQKDKLELENKRYLTDSNQTICGSNIKKLKEQKTELEKHNTELTLILENLEKTKKELLKTKEELKESFKKLQREQDKLDEQQMKNLLTINDAAKTKENIRKKVDKNKESQRLNQGLINGEQIQINEKQKKIAENKNLIKQNQNELEILNKNDLTLTTELKKIEESISENKKSQESKQLELKNLIEKTNDNTLDLRTKNNELEEINKKLNPKIEEKDLEDDFVELSLSPFATFKPNNEEEEKKEKKENKNKSIFGLNLNSNPEN